MAPFLRSTLYSNFCIPEKKSWLHSPNNIKRKGKGEVVNAYLLLDGNDVNKWRTAVSRTFQVKSTYHFQMRYSSRFEKVFEPAKWDVIVRVLQAPGAFSAGTVSSKSTRSQRTSRSGHTEYDLRYCHTQVGLQIWRLMSLKTSKSNWPYFL